MKTIQEIDYELNIAQHGLGQSIRIHRKGMRGHQGDVYVTPIKSHPVCWNVETTDQTTQGAVGQGEGSSHRAQGPVRVFWPDSVANAVTTCPVDFPKFSEAALRVCIGPVVVADGDWVLTHPKHAHHQFPAGVYLISYQLDVRTMQRVKD
jgi:hypothetical protein